jgi:hypothetical protein
LLDFRAFYGARLFLHAIEQALLPLEEFAGPDIWQLRHCCKRLTASLSGNLYKLWNRLLSGSYFPSPVRRVEIPKASGETRPLGIPTPGLLAFYQSLGVGSASSRTAYALAPAGSVSLSLSAVAKQHARAKHYGNTLKR